MGKVKKTGVSKNPSSNASFIVAGVALIIGWALVLAGSNIANNQTAVIMEIIAMVMLVVCLIASGLFLKIARRWWILPPLTYIALALAGLALAYVIQSLSKAHFVF